MMTEMMTQNAPKYLCEKCDYRCCKKSDLTRHCATDKCKMARNDDKMMTQKEPLDKFMCLCGRGYKYRQGLHVHMKKCDKTDGFVATMPSKSDELQILTNLVTELVKSNMELVKQNQDIQKQTHDAITQNHNQMLEIVKNGTNNVTTNSNNKSFNINLFLNEQCKDALNLTQFVKGIEVSREDLMNTGNLGFVNGISKILLDNLKQLGVHERPIHCTDFKRDIVYIKDEDKWTKEEDDKKLRIAIQEVSRKSMGTLINWKKSNPDYADVNSEFSQQCISMQRNSVAGDDRDTFFPKVIRALNKEMVVDKNLQN